MKDKRFSVVDSVDNDGNPVKVVFIERNKDTTKVKKSGGILRNMLIYFVCFGIFYAVYITALQGTFEKIITENSLNKSTTMASESDDINYQAGGQAQVSWMRGFLDSAHNTVGVVTDPVCNAFSAVHSRIKSEYRKHTKQEWTVISPSPKNRSN